MKIRFDFVTNSSSSSYVVVLALDEDGKITEERDSFDNPIRTVWKPGSPSDMTELFESIDSAGDFFPRFGEALYHYSESLDDEDSWQPFVSVPPLEQHRLKRIAAVFRYSFEENEYDYGITETFEYDYDRKEYRLTERKYREILADFKAQKTMAGVISPGDSDLSGKLKPYGFGAYLRSTSDETVRALVNIRGLFKDSAEVNNYVAFLRGEPHRKLSVKLRYVFFSSLVSGTKWELERHLRNHGKQITSRRKVTDGFGNNGVLSLPCSTPMAWPEYSGICRVFKDYRVLTLAMDIEKEKYVLLRSPAGSLTYSVACQFGEDADPGADLLAMDLFRTDRGQKMLFSDHYKKGENTDFYLVRTDNSSVLFSLPDIHLQYQTWDYAAGEYRTIFGNNTLTEYRITWALEQASAQKISYPEGKEPNAHTAPYQFAYIEYKEGAAVTGQELLFSGLPVENTPVTADSLKRSSVYLGSNKGAAMSYARALDRLGIPRLLNLSELGPGDIYVYGAGGIEDEIYERIAKGTNIRCMEYTELADLLEEEMIASGKEQDTSLLIKALPYTVITDGSDLTIDFRDRCFVTTYLSDADEETVASIVEKNGGLVKHNVTGKTSFLIVEDETTDSVKVRKVKAQLYAGNPVTVMTFEAFMEAVKNQNGS